MANAHARDRRLQKLADLQLTYPFWIFDIDQGPWPRKLKDMLDSARPAKLTGWYPWPWEYGTAVRRIDDSLPAHVIDRTEDLVRGSGMSIQSVLERLRYDDAYDRDAFTIIHEAETGKHELLVKKLSDWPFDTDDADFIAPRRVVRVQRAWDDVPFWDRANPITLFQREILKTNTCYGMASLVHDDGELLRATRIAVTDAGEKIRRAEFQLLDGDGEMVKGVVAERFINERGIILSRGPDFPPNKKLLVGTALENASWSEVEEYVLGKRSSPLTL